MSPVLYERSPSLAAIHALVARARTGCGGSLFVVGAAGTGRSAVLDAAVRDAEDDVAVVTGRADEMESTLGFALLGQLLPAATADAEDPTAPYLRALAALEAQDRPVLFAIDDLHWADADSLGVLAFLARRIADLPVALVATLRPWPEAARSAVDGLVERGFATTTDVPSLSREAARELLRDRLGRVATADEEARAWELCRGNPALTVVAAEGQRRASADGGRTALLDPRADPRRRPDAPPASDRHGAPAAAGPDSSGPAPALRAARFAGLQEDVLHVARCASVLGESFRPGVAVALAGLPQEAGDRALQTLHRSGLVIDGGGVARFAQPLLGRLLYAELAPAVRDRLHGRAFAELDRRGASEDAVEHALRAGLVGDPAAAELLERVGRTSLRRGAVDAAVLQLEAAVRFRGDGAGPASWIALAEACCAAGRALEGEAACRRALGAEDLDRGARIEALTLLGRCGYLAGAVDRGAAALEQAVALAAEHEPSAAIHALLQHAASAWAAGGPGAALPFAEEARRLAAHPGVDPLLRENAVATWGSNAAECGDRAGIEATLPVGRRILGDPAATGLTAGALVTPAASIYAFAHCAGYAERFDEAFAALELARRRIEDDGAAHALAMATLFVGNQRVRRGRLHAALADAGRAARFSELTPLTIPVAAALESVATAWLGRREESRAAAARARDIGADWWLIRVWCGIADGLGLLWAGDPAASAAFRDVEEALDGAGVREPSHTPWYGHAVAAHLLAGRSEDAERVLDRLEPHAEGHPGRWPGFVLLLGRARVDEHRGEVEAATDGYRDALDHLGDADLPLQRAEAQIALGGALRRQGRPVEARPHLADALRVAEDRGAEPLAEQARAALRLAGGRRRPLHDRDLLTAAELRVARAAAEGRSNAEVARSLHLSVNTVATHLKRSYAKLGISGRGQLAGVDLTLHGAADGPGTGGPSAGRPSS